MHTGDGIVPVPHETALIATIAIGLAFALFGGYIAVRLHLPPLVGYLVAGIAASSIALIGFGTAAPSMSFANSFSIR